MNNKRLNTIYITGLIFILCLLTACNSSDETLPKVPDSTDELIRKWEETLEKEIAEPSGLWIPFAPNANIDSVLAKYGNMP